MTRCESTPPPRRSPGVVTTIVVRAVVALGITMALVAWALILWCTFAAARAAIALSHWLGAPYWIEVLATVAVGAGAYHLAETVMIAVVRDLGGSDLGGSKWAPCTRTPRMSDRP